MTPDHERIEELLAGYALRALEGEDAFEVDRLLLEHVPTCITCRRTLDDFEAVMGDLALAAPAAEAPEPVLPSMLRDLDSRRTPGRGRFLVWFSAAAVIGVLALSGWNFFLHSEVGDSERRQQGLTSMINTLMKEDGSRMLSLESGDGQEASPVADPPTEPPAAPMPREPRLMVSFQPGAPHGWVLGMDVPPPTPGYVYQLWLGSGGAYTASERFLPDEIGVVQVFVHADLSMFDEISVTEEPAEGMIAQPATVVRWYAVVQSAEAPPSLIP